MLLQPVVLQPVQHYSTLFFSPAFLFSLTAQWCPAARGVLCRSVHRNDSGAAAAATTITAYSVARPWHPVTHPANRLSVGYPFVPLAPLLLRLPRCDRPTAECADTAPTTPPGVPDTWSPNGPLDGSATEDRRESPRSEPLACAPPPKEPWSDPEGRRRLAVAYESATTMTRPMNF